MSVSSSNGPFEPETVNLTQFEKKKYMKTPHLTKTRVPSPRGSSKLEEACDMYVRAANMYKMAKNWCGKMIALVHSNNINDCILLVCVCKGFPSSNMQHFLFQPLEMHSPKLPAFTCRCKASTTQRPTS